MFKRKTKVVVVVVAVLVYS